MQLASPRSKKLVSSHLASSERKRVAVLTRVVPSFTFPTMSHSSVLEKSHLRALMQHQGIKTGAIMDNEYNPSDIKFDPQ